MPSPLPSRAESLKQQALFLEFLEQLLALTVRQFGAGGVVRGNSL
jgi:hypothetical protein